MWYEFSRTHFGNRGADPVVETLADGSTRIRFQLAGFRRESIRVQLRPQDVLSVEARQDGLSDQKHSYWLGEDHGAVTAEYRDGLLAVTVAPAPQDLVQDIEVK